jgi:hypothetical protein
MTKAPTLKQRTKSDCIIYKTKKYNIFKKQKGNRQVKPNDFQSLHNKVEARDMLKYFPVLVNDKYEIIDGQHRVEVAEALGLTVFYMIVPDADLVTTKDINVTGKKWTREDFLNSYIELGNKHYIEIDKFLKSCDNRYSIATAVYLFTGRNDNNASKKFIEGEFVITKENRKIAFEIHEIINMFDAVGEKLTSFTHFIRCIRYMHLRNVPILWERLVEKCCCNINVIKSLPNDSRKVREILEEIYSQGMRKKADFSKEHSI